MKPIWKVLVSALVVFLLPAAALAGEVSADQVQQVQAHVELSVEPLPVDPDVGVMVEAEDATSDEACGRSGSIVPMIEFGIETQEAACCIDECRRDRDCDLICGGAGAGVCVRANSCCRECACTF